MSGVLTVLAAGGGQLLMLKAHSLADNTPGLAKPQVKFLRDGTVQFVTGDSGITTFPGEWGGSAPLSTMGDAYQVRATQVAGSFFDNEFDDPGVWITLSTLAHYVAPGSQGETGSASILFEIRRLSNQILVASATWNIVWDGTP